MKYALTNKNFMVVRTREDVKLVPMTSGLPDYGKPLLFPSGANARLWAAANPSFDVRPILFNPQPLALLTP